MSDEEKKAFNFYKDCNKKDLENYEYLADVSKEHVKYLESLLNLIEKQSKEIEELKEKDKPQPDCAEPIERTEEMVNMRWVNHNYILKSESEQKERKAYIKGTNDAHELCNKMWKDKIKAKIEEYDDKGMTVNLASRSAGKTFQQAVKVLQSLLEKE